MDFGFHCTRVERVSAMGAVAEMIETLPTPMKQSSGEAVHVRWVRLAEDFARLACVALLESDADGVRSTFAIRDVGELLVRDKHDEALAEAERYVVIGHTIRTGHVVEYDDIDDVDSLARWVRELDRASVDGWAPPVPEGFWASFLRWRTPLGMARLTDRRIRVAPSSDRPRS